MFEGKTTTYGEMARRVADLAGGLAERGVGRGEVVALLSYNCPEFLETVFAANYLGAIAMPINWRLAAPEVRYILKHSGACALVCDEPLVDLANEATKGIEATLVRACVRACVRFASSCGRMDNPRRSALHPDQSGARPGGDRRRPPLDVHLGKPRDDPKAS